MLSNKFMKKKFISFLTIISWIALFILLLLVRDKFWLGFIVGAYICLTIIALVKVIYKMEKNK